MTATEIASWSIHGSDGHPILGNTHMPTGGADCARGVVLLVHGFLGYKDYGMFPFMAQSFANAGLIAHRFNLAHSGMTDKIETFERPDLFALDTWNKQVFDINAVIDAVASGELAGKGLPCVLWGHSRGGVSVLLAAGRRFRTGQSSPLAGVITAAAPSFTNRMSEAEQREVLDRGYYEVVSNRTGQTLRIEPPWLTEQIDDPDAHDLLAHAADIRCPILIAHGKDDPTVPAPCAEEIAAAAGKDTSDRVTLLIVEGGNHVFNAPNPMPMDSEPAAQLSQLAAASTKLAQLVCPV